MLCAPTYFLKSKFRTKYEDQFYNNFINIFLYCSGLLIIINHFLINEQIYFVELFSLVREFFKLTPGLRTFSVSEKPKSVVKHSTSKQSGAGFNPSSPAVFPALPRLGGVNVVRRHDRRNR